MKRVAKFEKVSYKQFEKDYLDTFGLAGDDTSKRLRQEIESMYYGLELFISDCIATITIKITCWIDYFNSYIFSF